MSFFSDLYGSKPSVPTWQNITATGQQANATQGNISALPSLEQLSAGVTGFNASQLTGLLNMALPGWSSSTAQVGQNISSEIQGQLPADVQSEIQNSSAAKAVAGGVGGSEFGNNITAESLGLSSLNLMQQGQNSLESWTNQINQLFAPGQFNVASMFLSPQQEFQDTFQNQSMAYGSEWLASQINAMPNPQTVGETSFISNLVGGIVGSNPNSNLEGGSGGGGGGGGGGIMSLLGGLL